MLVPPRAIEGDENLRQRTFKTTIFSGFTNNARHQYAVMPDGRRFLVNVATTRADTSPIIIDVNRTARLKR